MAFLSKQPGEDDENAPQQQAATPTLGGGASASPMTGGGGGTSSPAPTMGGGASAAPQKSAMQGPGSNFTNLSSFLTPRPSTRRPIRFATPRSMLCRATRGNWLTTWFLSPRRLIRMLAYHLVATRIRTPARSGDRRIRRLEHARRLVRASLALSTASSS